MIRIGHSYVKRQKTCNGLIFGFLWLLSKSGIECDYFIFFSVSLYKKIH